MEALPAGTVTFLFTDIEGSTRLLQRQPERYGDILAQHRVLLRRAFASHRGREIGTQGDSFFVAFVRARDAVAAAIDAQQAVATHAWPGGVRLRVRMGIHTGEPRVGSEGYIGLGVHRAARICSAGHGGQVLLSDTTRQLIQDEVPAGVELRDLGVHRLKDLDRPEHLFQADIVGARADFPPLNGAAPVRGEPTKRQRAAGRERRGGEPPGTRRENGATGPAAGQPRPERTGASDPSVGGQRARARRRRQGSLSLAARSHAPAHIVGAALLAGGVVLALVAVLVAVRGDRRTATSRTVALDLAEDSVAGLAAGDDRPEVAVPLPGRPTGIAAAGGRVFVTTVDSAALTVVDGRTRSIVQTVPLPLKPAAVAVAGDRVYVLDPRGTVEGFRTGYDRPVARVIYGRRSAAAHADTTHPSAARSASLVADGDVLWATDGSPMLRRIVPRSGRVMSIPVGRPLDGVAIGDDAVWVFSSRPASVARIDRRGEAVTDVIPIVTRSGTDAPFPIGVATTPGTVWVLNGNTATLTRIDTYQRGVIATVAIGMDRAPRDIAASGGTVWIANADGSLSRLAPGHRAPSSLWVGQSLGRVAADGGTVWVTTTVLDQQLPGGIG